MAKLCPIFASLLVTLVIQNHFLSKSLKPPFAKIELEAQSLQLQLFYMYFLRVLELYMNVIGPRLFCFTLNQNVNPVSHFLAQAGRYGENIQKSTYTPFLMVYNSDIELGSSQDLQKWSYHIKNLYASPPVVPSLNSRIKQSRILTINRRHLD